MVKRVAIAEDDEPLRELWRRSIQRAADFAFQQAFARAEDALPVLAADPPDILIADWKLAGAMSGIELVARLKQLHPPLLAVVVSGFKLADLPPDALLAGADGFLRKPISGRELVDSLRQVLGGQCPFSQPAVALLRDRLRQQATRPPLPVGPLSPQQHRVMQLLAQGHKGNHAAALMGIEFDTFDTHRRRAFEKLAAHSLQEALNCLHAQAPAGVPFLRDMTGG